MENSLYRRYLLNLQSFLARPAAPQRQPKRQAPARG
jgi:hypothetical protein